MTTYTRINFAALTFGNETVRNMADLVMEQYILAGPFGQAHTIVPGIKYGKEVGLIGELGLVGKAAQGCEPTADTKTITAAKKTWSPFTWEVLLKMCISDLEGTLALYQLKNGPLAPDMTGTEYANMMIEKLGESITKMLWRLQWFADTDAANVDDSPAGVITSGVDTDYFTLGDGLWKQLIAIYGTTPARKTAFTGNSQATYALQESVATPTTAMTDFLAMIYAAPAALRAVPKNQTVIYATRSITDRLEQYLMGLGIIPTYENLIAGIPSLKVNGYDVTPIDIWDEIIRAYEDNGTKYNYPHRALFTTKANLLAGVPSTNAIEDINAFYMPDTRFNHLEARDGLSPLVLQDSLLQILM